MIKKSDEVKVFFDDYVAKFDDIYNHVSQETTLSNLVTKVFRKSMRKRMLNSFEDLKDQDIKSILDIGCGSGRYSNILAKKKDFVTGIDFADNMIQFAKKQADMENLKNVEFKTVAYEDFNYDRAYDAVICMGFFDYIKESKNIIVKILNNSPKIFLGSFPKEKNLLNFIRKLRYYINNCPLYYYDIEYLRSFESEFPDYKFDYIDLGREFYLRAKKIK